MNGDRLADDHIDLVTHEAPSNDPAWQMKRCHIRCYKAFLICFFLFGFVGCLFIPTPEHDLVGRGEINESDLAILTIGKTTIEDVLLRFGEPYLVFQDQSILIYHWRVSQHGIVAPGGGAPFFKYYLFMLEFDEDGYLKRFELGGRFSGGFQDRIDKWIQQDSE